MKNWCIRGASMFAWVSFCGPNLDFLSLMPPSQGYFELPSSLCYFLPQLLPRLRLHCAVDYIRSYRYMTPNYLHTSPPT